MSGRYNFIPVIGAGFVTLRFHVDGGFVLVASSNSIDLKSVDIKAPENIISIKHGHTEGIYDIALGRTVRSANFIDFHTITFFPKKQSEINFFVTHSSWRVCGLCLRLWITRFALVPLRVVSTHNLSRALNRLFILSQCLEIVHGLRVEGKSPSVHSFSCSKVSFRNNLLCSLDRIIKICNRTDTSQLRLIKGLDGIIKSLAFDPSRQFLACACGDNTVRIFDYDRQENPEIAKLAILSGEDITFVVVSIIL
jgi:WD40 repeat protein